MSLSATAETAGQAGSARTQRGSAFVDAHRHAAVALGRRLAELVGDPVDFGPVLDAGLQALADGEYQAGQHLVAPGLGATYGVRTPLLTAAAGALRKASVGTSPTLLLFTAERLLADERLEPRLFAFHLLDETLPRDPTRTWQLLRRAARDAGDWITVDSLAHPVARGIVLEPFRWAEIEQLTFAASVWERRLVAATIATIPFVEGRIARTDDYVDRALTLLATQIGDLAPDVQKALGWAYRTVAMVDRGAVEVALARETERAVADRDGHRAWVVRDAASKLAPDVATELKARLGGLRRNAGAPSTSSAAEVARRFALDGRSTQPTNVR